MSDEKRPYRKKRRAELEAETRRRITESAVALHERVGPAQTSISAIAEEAGVRRSTVYRHFPDEEALFAACSAHFRALHPPPNPAAWAAIGDPEVRTKTALRELYAFYTRTHRMYESLFRDESLVPAVERRLRDFHGYLLAVREVVAQGRGRTSRRTRAALGHAVAFATWRSLTQEQGLANEDAVALMCQLVRNASRR
jgi:AcrR family transcriptional regulator